MKSDWYSRPVQPACLYTSPFSNGDLRERLRRLYIIGENDRFTAMAAFLDDTENGSRGLGNSIRIWRTFNNVGMTMHPGANFLTRAFELFILRSHYIEKFVFHEYYIYLWELFSRGSIRFPLGVYRGRPPMGGQVCRQARVADFFCSRSEGASEESHLSPRIRVPFHQKEGSISIVILTRMARLLATTSPLFAPPSPAIVIATIVRAYTVHYTCQAPRYAHPWHPTPCPALPPA